MEKYLHPSILSPFKRYKQIGSLIGSTTRASNPDWHVEALGLNQQLHLRIDGSTIVSFYHDKLKNRWSNGPALTEEVLYDAIKLGAFISEVVRYAKSQGSQSLGVVLHVADEFALSELKAEFENPAVLAELKCIAVTDPGSILQDSSVVAEQAAWRVLPYPAGGSAAIGTAITVSQHYAPLFKLLRETSEAENFPIITHALSAPLVALLGLQETLRPTPGKPFVAILQYPWFTVLAFFNDHSDLRLLRTLQHRGLRRPTNFRNSLATSNAALEFVDPDLFLVQLGSNVDDSLAADLQTSFTASRVEVIEQEPRERMPVWCPEPVISLQPDQKAASKQSLTFQILREEKWALQDFLPTPKEIAEINPSRSEFQLFRWVKLAKTAIVIPAILGIGYLLYSAFTLSLTEESKFDSSQALQNKTRLANLTKEKQKIEHWNNILQDRSKAWVCLEFFARIFPENSGILVKTFEHKAEPETALSASDTKSSKVGFVRTWKLSGLLRDGSSSKVMEALCTKENFSVIFNSIADITLDQSFRPLAGKRNPTPVIKIRENASYNSGISGAANLAGDTAYKSTFDLTIKQEFNETDSLAIDITKAP